MRSTALFRNAPCTRGSTRKRWVQAECGMRNRGKNPKSTIRNPQSDGFTLVELLIVIAVLGLMLALTIPKLGEIGEANLKRSARHLTGMVRFLRDHAQATKEVYRIKFDIQSGHYWAEKLTHTSDKTVEFKRYQSTMVDEGSLSGATTFRDVHVASHPDDPSILFTPDGWVEHALIHLRDGDNKDFTLLVKPLMGDTELRDGYVEER
jgi:type II secretion system protein H